MLMTAEEYVAENSKVPACYNALGDVCVIFEHTDSGYDIKFYCEIPNVLETKSVVHCSTSEMFLSNFNEMKPVIDKWFTQLKKIYDSNINLVNSLTNEIDVDSLNKYINPTLRMDVGFTHFELGGYDGRLICFISNCREDIHKIVYLTEGEVVEVVNLHKEWDNCVMETSDKFESLCR
jgi:hypothetical protein